MWPSRRAGTAFAVGIGLLVSVSVTACSSTKSTTSPPPLSATSQAAPAATTSSAPAQATTTSAPAATTAVPTTTAAASGLSGVWSGQYSGAYQGTFTLTWAQAGTSLSGTIKLSSPPTTLPIDGTVSGASIQFGTLGSAAITYNGTIAGMSMSGSYSVAAGAGAGGGQWSANKSS
jgi:hypothetical protein